MESLLFAVIALVIVFPILYFVPMGFTTKGKISIVLSAFLVGVLGLLAPTVFEVWQTGLILLLVVSALVYLFDKKGMEWLYLIEGDEGSIVYAEEEVKGPVLELNGAYNHISRSDKVSNAPRTDRDISISRKQKEDSETFLEKLSAQNDVSAHKKENTYDRTSIVETNAGLLDIEGEITEVMKPERILLKKDQRARDDENDQDMETLILQDDNFGQKEPQSPKGSDDSIEYIEDLEKMLEDETRPEEDRIAEIPDNDAFELDELDFSDQSASTQTEKQSKNKNEQVEIEQTTVKR